MVLKTDSADIFISFGM
jgi:hypothetical protein